MRWDGIGVCITTIGVCITTIGVAISTRRGAISTKGERCSANVVSIRVHICSTCVPTRVHICFCQHVQLRKRVCVCVRVRL